jgi:pimeloyl-ACP methyl ester carboxylesterase
VLTVPRLVLVSALTLTFFDGPSKAATGSLSALEPCAVARFPARCGTLDVAENRQEPAARRLAIRVVVLPATGSRGAVADPLLVLEGGPGASILATAPRHAANFGQLRAQRDLVFVEQRGTGESGSLDCGPGPADLDPETVAACRERVAPRADLRFYGSHHAVADLIEAIDGLGHERVDVFAVSYGTRTALELVRRHPERVRTVSLLGTYPPGRNAVLDAPALLDRSLELVASACAADPPCRNAHPGLRDSIAMLSARLDSGELEASRLEVASALRRMLHFPLTAVLVPRAVTAAARGDLSGLRAVADAMSVVAYATSVADATSSAFGAIGIADGAFLSLLCSEDVARLDAAQVERAGRDTLLRGAWGAALIETCREWPRAEVPADFHAPLEGRTPILSLTGELDPAMHPSWGVELADSMPQARHLTLPQAQHGLQGIRGIGCVIDLIEDFVAEGSARDLDASCLAQMRRRPWAL